MAILSITPRDVNIFCLLTMSFCDVVVKPINTVGEHWGWWGLWGLGLGAAAPVVAYLDLPVVDHVGKPHQAKSSDRS